MKHRLSDRAKFPNSESLNSRVIRVINDNIPKAGYCATHYLRHRDEKPSNNGKEPSQRSPTCRRNTQLEAFVIVGPYVEGSGLATAAFRVGNAPGRRTQLSVSTFINAAHLPRTLGSCTDLPSAAISQNAPYTVAVAADARFYRAYKSWALELPTASASFYSRHTLERYR